MNSAVYVTLNESEKLKKSLESVQDFVSEVVIVDLGSDDNVEEIAKEFKCKFYRHPQVRFVELVRDYAISKTTRDWVLVLDPDELLTEQLTLKLQQVTDETSTVAVNIPRKNIFFGKWVKHTNFWPDRQIRFFRKKAVVWPKRIHTYPKVDGKTLQLEADPDLAIQHFGYSSWLDFWKRQERYSTVEAENLYQEGKRFSFLRIFWNPLRVFLVRLIRHAGFLDGINGLFLVFALMYFSIISEIKLLKLSLK